MPSYAGTPIISTTGRHAIINAAESYIIIVVDTKRVAGGHCPKNTEPQRCSKIINTTVFTRGNTVHKQCGE